MTGGMRERGKRRADETKVLKLIIDGMRITLAL